MEERTGRKLGGSENPLLISVRSGAVFSMPGMMDTILNLGISDESVVAIAEESGNERFAWDCYRRFIQMYGDVVIELKPEKKEDHDPFEVIIDKIKEKKGVELDTQLGVDDLKHMVDEFKALVRNRLGRDFPNDPWEQLWGAIMAVFQSWNNDRAIFYRRMNEIPDAWGTAVNVQDRDYSGAAPETIFFFIVPFYSFYWVYTRERYECPHMGAAGLSVRVMMRVPRRAVASTASVTSMT